jgi:hypothetical protein
VIRTEPFEFRFALLIQSLQLTNIPTKLKFVARPSPAPDKKAYLVQFEKINGAQAVETAVLLNKTPIHGSEIQVQPAKDLDAPCLAPSAIFVPTLMPGNIPCT